MMAEKILVISGAAGAYAPMEFAQKIRPSGVGYREVELLRLGPHWEASDEGYWEAWGDVLDHGYVDMFPLVNGWPTAGVRYRIYQSDNDGSVWLVPEEELLAQQEEEEPL
jgi:hypothetical protein